MSETNDYDMSSLTPEQALEMAKAKGVELTPEQLDQIAGGSWSSKEMPECPICHSNEHVRESSISYYCSNCEYGFI